METRVYQLFYHVDTPIIKVRRRRSINLLLRAHATKLLNILTFLFEGWKQRFFRHDYLKKSKVSSLSMVWSKCSHWLQTSTVHFIDDCNDMHLNLKALWLLFFFFKSLMQNSLNMPFFFKQIKRKFCQNDNVYEYQNKIIVGKSLFRRISSSLTNDDHCPAPAIIVLYKQLFLNN